MRFFKPFNTVFYKLIISFTALTVIITIILGATSYIYFSSNFNSEVEKVNQKILDHEQKTIELSILKRIETIYLDLAIPQTKNADILYLYENSLEGNTVKLFSAHRYINEIRNYNSDFIDAIHVYIPFNHVVISSPAGIKYMKDPGSESYKNFDWVKEISSPPATGIWLDRNLSAAVSEDGFTPLTFSYLREYPLVRSSANAGFIVININEAALSSIIKDISPDTGKNTFIINKDGRILSHIDKNRLMEDLGANEYIQRVVSAKDTNSSFIEKVDGVPCMVSYAALGNTGWKLLSYSPLDQFYKKSMLVQQMLILFCIITLLIGFILTNIFTSRIYNPLKTLLEATRRLFGDTRQGGRNKQQDEYIFINNVINELSVKVNELQNTLRDNQPLIRHNFVLSMLQGRISTEEELADYLKILHIAMDRPFYAGIVLELDGGAMQSISIENNQFTKYRLIKEIESYADEARMLLATELSGCSIGVVFNGRQPEEKFLTVLVEQICSYAYANFMIHCYGAIGGCADTPAALNASFLEAVHALKYRYFIPGGHIFYGRELWARERCMEQLPSTLAERLSSGLKRRDLPQVRETLEEFAELAKHGSYSADHCHQKILEFTGIFSNYMISMHVEEACLKEKYNDMLAAVKNSKEYGDWLHAYAREVFAVLESRNNKRSRETVEKIKKFILAHMAEELSLESIADMVGLNPRYLSRMFKEEAGINYVDYVNEKRLETARELLVSSQLPLEDICKKVGYNSPSYFIRQFKKTYGDTPNNYKRASRSEKSGIK